MAKSKLVSEAARDLFAAGRKMHERPLTLKATHPAWQVKKAEATHEDPARARQKVKGAWGDMYALQMLEKLDEQQREEEETREAVAEHKQQQAERKEERLAEEARKRDARETALPRSHSSGRSPTCSSRSGSSRCRTTRPRPASSRASRAKIVLTCSGSALI